MSTVETAGLSATPGVARQAKWLRPTLLTLAFLAAMGTMFASFATIEPPVDVQYFERSK